MIIVAKDHLTAETIEKYSMGKLSLDECDNAEEHLLVCESCQVALEEMDDYLIHMREAAQRLVSQPEPDSLWDRIRDGIRGLSIQPLPVAAALCAVAVLIFVIPASRISVDEPPQQLALQASRGEAASQSVAANRKIDLKLNLDGLTPFGSYRITIVDSNGSTVFTTNAAKQGAELVLTAPALKKGAHFVRIHSPSSELLREFLLQVN